MKEYIMIKETGNAPITVSELIRCKDCKYYTGYECMRSKISNVRCITEEDDYCSRAERRVEE